MENVNIKNKEYITIKEAQAHIVTRSAQWYRQRIREDKINAIKTEGRGGGFLILTESLLSYLESLSNV